MSSANIEDIYALAPMQQGMLFHSLYAPRSGVYVEQLHCRLDGELDAKAFADAWQRVIDRHPSLRTAFVWEDLDEPVQVVCRTAPLSPERHDWRGLSEVEQGEQLRTFLETDRSRGFELTQAPLIRLALIRLTDTSHRFIWSFHHLLLDGWSTQIVLKEAFVFYEAFRRGRNLDLALPHPYRDYIAWLRQQDLAVAESFWRRTLQGFAAPTPLVIERAGSSRSDRDATLAEQRVSLSASAYDSLRMLSRRHHLTLSSIVQGAWALLLSRYTGQTDVVFGTVVAGRPSSLRGVESMIGLFVNTLPVRVNVLHDEPASVWLKKLQGQQVELREYEYSPLVKVQTWNDVPPGTALFESLLVFENYPTEDSLAQRLESLEIRDVHLIESTNYPLTILIAADQGLSLRIIYDADRFDSSTISRMLGHYCTLLGGMAASPDEPLSSLPLLTEAERKQLLYAWNNTRTQDTPAECAHQLFEAQVERVPHLAAVTFADKQITYSELNQRANQLARRLRRHGVGPDAIVGLLVERSPEMVIGLLGILKAGAAYVPLDPAYPRQRLAFMIRDAKVSLVLTQKRLMGNLPDHDAQAVAVDADWQDITDEDTGNLHINVTADHPAYVIYTSGSTGRPKGVEMTHRALSNLLAWQLQNSAVGAAAKTLQFASLSFDVSFQEIFSTLGSGGNLILISEELQRDVSALWRFISHAAVERLFLPFVALQQVARIASDLGIYPVSLREVITAGEPLRMTPQIASLFEKLENCSLENQYGPTESHVVTSFRLSPPVNGWPGRPPIGRPIANSQVYVLDDDSSPVPVGVPGELYLGGACLARGYIHRPELTRERFVAHPFDSTPGARLYKTGDIARYLPDGNLEFVGRSDEQAKVRGYRIEPGEIESVLSTHPAVQESAVIVSGQDDEKRIVAYIVSRGEISLSDLRGFLKESLPDYMIPSAFMIIDKLPVTASGKLDRRALPATAAEPLDPSAGQSVLARNLVEEIVSEIWAAVLMKTRVGVHDSFFELGGHSLLATQLLSRLRDAFQLELPLRSLFESPTVAGIASKIAELRLTDRHEIQRPLQKVARDENLPLSFAQERMWFFDQLTPGSSDYNVPLAIRLLGPLDVPVLERSLSEIIRRHEVLRTTFTTVEGRPVQVIAPAIPVPIPIVDLRRLPEVERDAEVGRLALAEADRPFDLARGPLLRVTIVRLGDAEHVLLLTTHHIAFDGWSLGVFSREVSALYTAFSAGKPSPLPELPIQYVDFAHWQRQLLQGEFAADHLSYWKREFRDGPRALEMPLDRPRSIVLTAKSAAERFTLPPALSRSLKDLGRREGVTLFMTLLAAFKTLLFRYTGQEQITVGSPIANRNRLETEGLIGCFINPLALRTELTAALTFQDLLRRVREVALGAYAHQDLPFEKLVAELQPERDLSRTPLFQAMLIWQNAPLSIPEIPGLSLQPLEVDSHKSVFDLTLTMWEASHEIHGLMEYNAGLFDSATIQGLLGHYATLLEGIAADPEQQLCRLPLMTEPELRQQLTEWKGTRTEGMAAVCIHQLFEEQVERTPDAVAVTLAGRQLTYRELNQRANQLAHYLRKQGVGPEVLVGLMMERSVEMVIGMLGILKAGGAYVPLDATYPQQRLSFMVEDAGLKLVVTEERWTGLLAERGAHAVPLDTMRDLIAEEDTRDPAHEAAARNLAYVIYTSGSTGTPKGVMIQHSSMVNYSQAARIEYGVTSADRVLQFSSISFDTSIEEIFPALTCGATLVLRDASPVDSTSEFLRKCHQWGITVLSLPTAYWHQLVAHLNAADTALLASLRLLILGGERARPERLRAWQRQVGARVRLVNSYGPTEATVVTTTCDVSNMQIDDDRREVPIGRPIRNAETYVLDQHLNAVPIGVHGELHIGGAGLARGYLNRPALTAERFIEHPFDSTPGARLYKTDDIARHLPDGTLEFIGRSDEQVKVRGYRIELGEIESVLSDHPGVRACLVIAREDASSEQSLIAYVVPSHEQIVATTDLRSFLRERLPPYMVPSAFVTLDELPLTASGKVDRHALPAPGRKRPESERPFVAPRNATEEKLAKIWAEVLEIEQVGVHDNFFDLGGHSLLATHLLFRLRDGLQRDIPLHWLFEAPTISELAEKIGVASPDPDSAIDLQGEAVLDPTIEPQPGAAAFVAEPINIFLTGATGFLGAFLLSEILQQTEADVHCLVRAPDPAAGMKKLKENLQSYSLWRESSSTRLVPVLGDLAQPLLGLSAEDFDQLAGEIDVIYHNGALVNAAYPYSALKAANVLGTQEVLRLACRDKVKPVHFVSTLSVFAQRDSSQMPIREQDQLDLSTGVAGGYAQSKLVAEQLVTIARSRGLPVSIYRPGRITGHSQTGVCNTDDLMCKLIRLSLELRTVPDLDLMVDLTPVDYVSKAIVHLSRKKESRGKAFHLVNPSPLPWAGLVDWLRSYGYSFQQTSLDHWRQALMTASDGQPTNHFSSLLQWFYENDDRERRPLAQQSDRNAPALTCENTLEGLDGSSVVCPPVEAELLGVYFSYFVASGLLPRPPAIHGARNARSYPVNSK